MAAVCRSDAIPIVGSDAKDNHTLRFHPRDLYPQHNPCVSNHLVDLEAFLPVQEPPLKKEKVSDEQG